MCEYAHEVDKQCPLVRGPLTIAKTVDIPNEIPPVSCHLSDLTIIQGRYRVHVDAFVGPVDEETGLPIETITCLDVDFRMTLSL